MFQNIEELKNEIEIFRDNMNRSNGSIALISEAIEQLNSNLYTLKQLSEKFDLTKKELESKIDKLESNQKSSEEEMLQKLDDSDSKIKENIDSLNRQIEEFKVSIEENTNKHLKTIKILGGIVIALLAVLLVLNIFF